MSGIFNLLGGIAEPDKDQAIKPMARSKTSHEIRPNSLKAMGSTKLKGLSMRSNSDMNMSQSVHPTTIKKDTFGNKEQNFLKPKVTQVDSSGCPISPGTEAKRLASSKFKEYTSKKETTTKKVPLSDDNVFKEPMHFKKSNEKFLEPEELAPWNNDQHEFDYGYIDAIDKEFINLLQKREENIKTRQEKMFISEISNFEDIPDFSDLCIPGCILDTPIDEVYNDILSPDLPEMSDISEISETSDDDY
ncbi:hypothetical protein DMN91_009982 [Ooceraea biroi]|uniref:Securin n=1 Tax=Ooceraea biroi TaxID=2015173 RepID=A0A026WXM4_OOCBI|nr:uncharacterized protein LOC113562845 [Ooceraea biroi]EZA60568.1 hypothetical protein X777_14594 [Ooceraea biroi]RLU17745.1 hypothetical protein DMN91_009982 [Ooceraea biroi]